MDHRLECQRCGAVFEPGGYPEGCPDCRDRGEAGRLEVVYDPDAVPDEPLAGGEPTDMWTYRSLLPLVPGEPVTFGEGGTPLVVAPDLSDAIGADVRLKNETVNPSWSFKDRLNSLLVGNAAAFGHDRIATSSTGNHGASTAMYAHRAGIDDVIVMVPHATEAPARLQIRAYGAETVVTDYATHGDLLGELVDRGWYPTVNVTEPHTGLAYAFEAYKTIAFELVDQLGGIPDAVVVPVGSGDGLYGVWKGFRELYDLGVISDYPRMIGSQPIELAPLTEALTGGDPRSDYDAPEPITTSTMSDEVGSHAVEAIRDSDGTAYAIPKEAVEAGIHDAGLEGVYLEPASALPIATLGRAADDGAIESDDIVVCLATGAGVKWPDHTEGAIGAPPEIEPTLEALADAVSVSIESD